jgi:hypothetical protein
MPAHDSHGSRFQLDQLIDRLSRRPEAEIRFAARRPDDHLVLDLLFDNLRIEQRAGNGAEVVRADPHRRGIMIVEFPPQSFGEEAFEKPSTLDVGAAGEQRLKQSGSTGPVLYKPSVRTDAVKGLTGPRVRMSGPSRIAFVMPDAVDALPFTLAAVLDAMRRWSMRLDVNAHPDVPVLMGPLNETFEMVRDAISSGLNDRTRLQVDAALRDGVRRIADASAGGLDRSGPAELAQVMWSEIRRESAVLGERHPELGKNDLHTATLAALAVGASASLATLAESAGIRAENRPVFEKLPYLPLVFGQPHEPGWNATALELPYRLWMSPLPDARWGHASLPVVQGGRTELWHTRLSPADPSRGDAPLAIRVLWSPDFDGRTPPPFTMSLDRQEREFLVRLMADWTQRTAGNLFPFLPRPAAARRLHLSSLGALLDVQGAWDPRPQGVDLEQWRHLGTLGRDHYVRVAHAGYLLPFGHAASLVKVTERAFEPLDGDPETRIAVLRQRFFILVKEPVRRYVPLRADHQLKGRNFPFDAVEILTQVTPDLLAPAGELPLIAAVQVEQTRLPLAEQATITPRMAFWPQVGPNASPVDFRFEVAAFDRTGTRVTFSLPMLFVGEVVNATGAPQVRASYSSSSTTPTVRRTAELNGAAITYDVDPLADPQESRLSTARLVFATAHIFPFDHGTNTAAQPSALAPNFFPEIEEAAVNVPALQRLLGRGDAFDMTYPQVETAAAFDNAGRVFLWAKAPNKLEFGGGTKAQTDALGGIASPEMAVIGLSSITGPVSGPLAAKVADAIGPVLDNTFDPAAFFGEAKLLGGVKLADVVQVAASRGLGGAPRFVASQVGTDAVSRFDWETDVKPAGPFLPNADRTGGSRLVMRGQVVTPADGTRPPTREAFATIGNFKLNLFDCIILWFDQITFDMQPGQKPDVTVQLHAGEEAVVFGGVLEFVNEFRKYIPSNGFSDPPALSVTPSGITAGYSLGLPVMAVGIFSLSNVSLGAGFSLPFDSRPISVRFNFSERERPFSLIVSGLGGGGFFAIALGANGVQEIEAALEFGAAIAINLGVASGSVEIKAGVYFHWSEDGIASTVVIAGYIRIHGELTVLCLISASLTFHLQIGYQKQSPGTSMVFGEAELIVEIEVVFLSFDVAVRCRREFAGGPADPKFIDLIPDASVWSEYCDAFATEAP